MRFIINKQTPGIWRDRIEILRASEKVFRGSDFLYDKKVIFMCNTVIKTTCDWDIEDTFAIVSDTDSIQYRPKALFRNSKGVYYKGVDKKMVYLTPAEVYEMNEFISAAKRKLEIKYV